MGHDHDHAHDKQADHGDLLAEIAEGLRHEFQIGHSTIQVDAAGAGEDCAPCSERPSASAAGAA